MLKKWGVEIVVPPCSIEEQMEGTMRDLQLDYLVQGKFMTDIRRCLYQVLITYILVL